MIEKLLRLKEKDKYRYKEFKMTYLKEVEPALIDVLNQGEIEYLEEQNNELQSEVMVMKLK